MRMKATISKEKLADLIKVPARVWYDAGNALRLRIIRRTRLDGVDADGQAFEPYSEGYKRAKAKKGGVTGGGRVNLTSAKAGSHMLDTMVLLTKAETNPRIEMRFSLADKNRIANYHMGEGRVDREFFAMSDDDIEAIMTAVRASMKKRGLV